MSKYIVIELNGTKENLDFEAFYFLKFYGEITGSDPLMRNDVLTNTKTMFETTCALVFAGLKTDYRINKKPFPFTMEDVEGWVGIKPRSEMIKFIQSYAALEKSDEGEGEPAVNGQLVGTN